MKPGELKVLQPFLVGSPTADEVDMYCPFHGDKKRSAQLNTIKGVWYCHGCGMSGKVSDLVRLIKEYGATPGAGPQSNGQGARSNGQGAPTHALPSDGTVAGWHSALLSEEGALNEFTTRRGITLPTIRRFEIGWDRVQAAYTIPIRNATGDIVNVRFYQFDPADERRKIWSVAGHGDAHLYPLEILEEPDPIVICEGEWDALLAIQHGLSAITRTGGASVWHDNWRSHFEHRRVYLCHDMDTAGQGANAKVYSALRSVARSLTVVSLPYEVTKKNGKDLTDFFHHDGQTAEDFWQLAEVQHPSMGEQQPERVEISVLDSLDASRSGAPLIMNVTITGRMSTPYMAPGVVDFRCDMNAGPQCQTCPMHVQHAGFLLGFEMPSQDRRILEMINTTDKVVAEALRHVIGANKCQKLTIEVVKHQSVEELYVRPSIDTTLGNEQGDYVSRKIINVGRHDTMPNNTVEIHGTIYPEPKTQANVFQAWAIKRTETSLDVFQMTEELKQRLSPFLAVEGRPLEKVKEIGKDLVRHVTKIYGRPEMHTIMDLTYHSPLLFDFGGQRVTKGWIESLVVGDTRTGKSEAALRLLQHYGAGQIISCESASYAGVVGGLEQFAGKEWVIKWGTIPINDRRLVILDEVSGLLPEQISAMSSIRSSGEAQITKITSERTYARTRLIWLGNPREAKMTDYAYGCLAIQPLIGNNEDIARFDLAMSLSNADVSTETINRERNVQPGRQVYTADICHELLMWAWTRRPDQIVWQPGAEKLVYQAAIKLSGEYFDTPPLIQPANVRIKIAKIAISLAARTFSTNPTGELLVVGTQHVEDALKFIDGLYAMPGFGYKEMSKEHAKDLMLASSFKEEAREYIMGHKGLARFIRTTGRFKRADLEEVLAQSREEANKIINRLTEMRMLRKESGFSIANHQLHELVREME